MNRVFRWSLPVLVLAIAWGVAQWIKQASPEASVGKPRSESALLVSVQELSRRDFSIELRSYGELQAQRYAQVQALVSGQIQWLSPDFEVGGYVEKGQVLLKLDQADYRLALQQAQSDLAAAELALAEEEARSRQAARDWSKSSAQPDNEYALRKPQLRAAKASLETAQARLVNAQLNLERTQVKSPFTGFIQETNAELGALASPGSVLATGFETSYGEVRLPIANKDQIYLPKISTQSPDAIRVQFFNRLFNPEQVWEGYLVRSEASLDESTQQLHVVARIPEPFALAASDPRQPLRLRQYLEAKIEAKQAKDVLPIPNSSLYQGRYVYLVEGDALKRVEVTIGWKNAEYSFVEAGLEAGDLLVTTPLGQVSTGTRVEIAEAEISQSGLDVGDQQ